jgi:hypothetical protein
MILVLQASLMTVALGLETTVASGSSAAAAAGSVARVSAKRILHREQMAQTAVHGCVMFAASEVEFVLDLSAYPEQSNPIFGQNSSAERM